ncbi:hypothetical protein TMEC54S_00193 [Thauera mechernichensis]
MKSKPATTTSQSVMTRTLSEMGWKDGLIHLLQTKGRATAPQRGRRKPVSERTVDKRADVLFRAFRQLEALGYRIRTLDGFKRKHVEVLARHWEQEGLSALTIQNNLSSLRTLAAWMGKEEMVGRSSEFVSDPIRVRRKTNATYDHSWSAAGVDVEAVLQMASAMDAYVGMQLRLCHAFCLRREEAVMFRPRRADKGSYIDVEDGTKGGRHRVVQIRTEYQRRVLDEAKAFVKGVNGHVGDPERDLKGALRRFSYVMEKCGATKSGLGVTAHGLRHQGLNDLFEEIAGVPSPIRTSNPREVLSHADPEKVEYARAVVSETAGHARLSITGSYIGGLAGRDREPSPAEKRYMAHWTRFFELHGRSLLTETEKQEKARLRKILRLDEDKGDAPGHEELPTPAGSDEVNLAAGGA